MTWPFPPPIETMEAKVMEAWPTEGKLRYAYEPKWDGFRSVSWSGPEPRLDSRNQRPLLRYFPELTAALAELPAGTVVDGEVVVVIDDVTDFDALQQRVHPAASRIKMLSNQTPSQLVAFDFWLSEERIFAPALRRATGTSGGARCRPWRLVESHSVDHRSGHRARRWFDEFESAGCDGIVAKQLDLPYVHGKRAMIKIKHRRTADCVVGGYREHKDGGKIGSLLLGLYNDKGELHFIGHCSGFPRH